MRRCAMSIVSGGISSDGYTCELTEGLSCCTYTTPAGTVKHNRAARRTKAVIVGGHPTLDGSVSQQHFTGYTSGSCGTAFVSCHLTVLCCLDHRCGPALHVERGEVFFARARAPPLYVHKVHKDVRL